MQASWPIVVSTSIVKDMLVIRIYHIIYNFYFFFYFRMPSLSHLWEESVTVVFNVNVNTVEYSVGGCCSLGSVSTAVNCVKN